MNYIKSPTAYEELRNHFILPGRKTFRNYTYDFGKTICNKNYNLLYLQQQYNLLEPHERLVSLKIDEIHIQPKITYSSQRICGFASNKSEMPANQVQAYMISSLLSKYKEIVRLIPVRNNTAESLHKYILEIIKDLEKLGMIFAV